MEASRSFQYGTADTSRRAHRRSNEDTDESSTESSSSATPDAASSQSSLAEHLGMTTIAYAGPQDSISRERAHLNDDNTPKDYWCTQWPTTQEMYENLIPRGTPFTQPERDRDDSLEEDVFKKPKRSRPTIFYSSDEEDTSSPVESQIEVPPEPAKDPQEQAMQKRRQSEDVEFRKRLKKDFVIKPMPKDGECLFRCIMTHLRQNFPRRELGTELVRAEIGSYIDVKKKVPDHPLHYLSCLDEEARKELEQITQPRAFGGQIACLAASHLYNIKIVVHYPNAAPVEYDPQTADATVLRVAFFPLESHYDLLIPKNEQGCGQPAAAAAKKDVMEVNIISQLKPQPATKPSKIEASSSFKLKPPTKSATKPAKKRTKKTKNEKPIDQRAITDFFSKAPTDSSMLLRKAGEEMKRQQNRSQIEIIDLSSDPECEQMEFDWAKTEDPGDSEQLLNEQNMSASGAEDDARESPNDPLEVTSNFHLPIRRRHGNSKANKVDVLRLTCPIKKCGFFASTLEEVQRHGLQEHGERVFECLECTGATFTQRGLYHHHLHCHTLSDRDCFFCPTTLANCVSLRVHIFSLHRERIGLLEPAGVVTPVKQGDLLVRLQEVMQVPSHLTLLHREQFVIAFDMTECRPVLAFEDLNAEMIQDGNSRRESPAFSPDPQIPKHQVTDTAIKYLGFENGHLAAARNQRSSKKAFAETFLMSNVVPQQPRVNVGCWRSLEMLVRQLTSVWSSVRVITGAVYSDNSKVKSQGCVWVNIPSHLFKIVLLERPGESLEGQAFLVPNMHSEIRSSIFSFRSTMEQISKMSGVQFRQINDVPMSWDIARPAFHCTMTKCSIAFSTVEELAEHTKKKHDAENRCTLCQRLFETADELDVHVEDHHTHRCQWPDCEFRTPHSQYLDVHFRRHAGIKPFECEFPGCTKRFVTESGRSSHMMVHSEERPYVCNVDGCNNGFKRNESLTKHKKDHADGKILLCTFCGTMFHCRWIKPHQARDHGLRPYICGINGCGAAFGSRDFLRYHRLRKCGLVPAKEAKEKK